uniref:NADH-ubiquinone oxidoreductase chain 3 n=1 Tax=Asobara japonica TaxID=554476 RepID=A0A6B9XQ21_9HYME|nr:NADH dehydrogenase subunit 3 [Asobara japonica]QHR84921.1 NADH dehydrogenase subunit 3 [Asobara japonica]
MLYLIIFLLFIICLILFFINLIFGKKDNLDREKMSSFECGFISISSSRLPFSIHFYLIGILFLIFDMEIIFLLPMMILLNYLNLFEWMYISFIIIIILYLGLEFEKKEGSLKWIF